MADALLPLSPAAAGGQIEDVEQLNIVPPVPPAPPAGQIAVVRQRIEIVGALLAEIARVQNTVPIGTEFALVTRNIVPTTTTATPSSVDSSLVSVLLLAANSLRKQAIIVNDSTAVLFVAFAAVASATVYTYALAAGSTLELPSPIYTGDISGIWDVVNGNARITELT